MRSVSRERLTPSGRLRTSADVTRIAHAGRRGAKRGVTLVETLVTIVLLAMLASVGTGALMGAASGGERARGIASVRRADALARSLARAERSVELRLTHGGTTIETWLSADAEGTEPMRPEWQVDQPPGSTGSFHGASDGSERASIAINRSGHSEDGTYLLRMPSGDVSLDLAGRTGQLVERREGTP
jgi:prepilin-type N-terminal cleavage/methylation domain-containing protein